MKRIKKQVECMVILDRDGTINKEKGVINHPQLLELEYGAAEAVLNLNKMQIPVVVITNQPALGREIISEEILRQTHERLYRLLGLQEAYVDALYYCPHFPSVNGDFPCNCRKPATGLVKQALQDLNISPQRIYVVGDRSSDMELAENLDGTGILVKTGYGLGEWHYHKSKIKDKHEHVAEDLYDAVSWIAARESNDKLPATPHFRWPDITEEMSTAVLHQLHRSMSIGDDSGVIGDLEREWAAQTKRHYAVSFNSGTMALYSTYKALGIKSGDEVIVPAYGFFSTATPLLSLNAAPVFVDVDETGNLHPAYLEKKLTNKTKAIVVSHIFGNMADLKEIKRFSHSHNLPVIEDASHAFLARRDNFTAGKGGKAAVFSLQSNKLCPAGEGGIMVTDDEELFIRATMQGHLKKRNLNLFGKGHELFLFYETGAGLKLRLHPLAAAAGLVSLKRAEEIRGFRREFVREIKQILDGCSEVSVMENQGEAEPSYYILPLLLSSAAAQRRDELRENLKKRGVTDIHFDISVGVIPWMSIMQQPQVLHPDHPGMKTTPDCWEAASALKERVVLFPVGHKQREYTVGIKYAQLLKEELGKLRP